MYTPIGGNARFVKAAEEFDAKHGGDPVFIGEAGLGGYYLFRDGATRPYDDQCLAHGVEPPGNRDERILLILQWHELHAKKAAAAFNKLRNRLNRMAHNAQEFAGRGDGQQPPSDADIEQLQKLQIEARVRQTLFEKVREEFGNKQHPAIETRQVYANHVRDRALTQAAKIEDIKI
ncbi:hypothetical protein [Lacipirellula sp.]|uniref:hypothetical protein n=1 Tax=Lacipirellula sp. TaxID=2691419 RepID=UPI003D117EEA